MHGAATFLRLPTLAQKLDEVPGTSELHVDFEHLSYIDHACLDLLMNWAKQHEGTGGKLVLDWESLHGRFAADPAVEAKAAMAARRAPGSDNPANNLGNDHQLQQDELVTSIPKNSDLPNLDR